MRGRRQGDQEGREKKKVGRGEKVGRGRRQGKQENRERKKFRRGRRWGEEECREAGTWPPL